MRSRGVSREMANQWRDSIVLRLHRMRLIAAAIGRTGDGTVYGDHARRQTEDVPRANSQRPTPRRGRWILD